MNVIGDVDGRTCIIQDDIVDTAGTITKAATALKVNGAERVLACAVRLLDVGDFRIGSEEYADDDGGLGRIRARIERGVLDLLEDNRGSPALEKIEQQAA